MVAVALTGLPGVRHVPGIRQLGRLAGEILYIRAVSFAILFAGTFRRLSSRLVRPQALVVPELSAVLAGATHPVDTRPLPPDLLLLSRRILHIVLGRSAGVRGGRAAQKLSRRTELAAHPAKFPPLFSPAVLFGLVRFGLRRHQRVLVPGWLRHRRGKHRAVGERDSAGWLRFWLPCVPAPDWRDLRSDLGSSGPPQAVQLRDLPERKPQEMGMGKSVLGGLRRYLRPPVLDGNLARLENPLSGGIPDVPL